MKQDKYINPKRAGFIGHDGERDNADRLMGRKLHKFTSDGSPEIEERRKGGSVSRKSSSKKSMSECSESKMMNKKIIKRAIGGVAKIRHGQSTADGSPKGMRRLRSESSSRNDYR